MSYTAWQIVLQLSLVRLIDDILVGLGGVGLGAPQFSYTDRQAVHHLNLVKLIEVVFWLAGLCGVCGGVTHLSYTGRMVS